MEGLYRPRWTNTIHDEWIGNLLKGRPDLTPERLDRTRNLMNLAVPDCLVEGFETLIDGLVLPDPDDRHVLAAAITASAELIVTYNLADFPATKLSTFNIESQHPDDFLARLINADADAVCSGVKKHRESLRNPPKTIEEYFGTLAHLSLPQTVASLAPHSAIL